MSDRREIHIQQYSSTASKKKRLPGLDEDLGDTGRSTSRLSEQLMSTILLVLVPSAFLQYLHPNASDLIVSVELEVDVLQSGDQTRPCEAP